MQANTQQGTDGNKQAKRRAPLEAFERNQLLVDKEGQLDPVDGGEQNNPGGHIISLGKFLREQEEVHHRSGSMGKGARKACANTAGDAGQVRGSPGRGIPGNLLADKLPAHKTNGEQANKQAEVVGFQPVNKLYSQPRANGDAGQEIFQVIRAPVMPVMIKRGGIAQNK